MRVSKPPVRIQGANTEGASKGQTTPNDYQVDDHGRLEIARRDAAPVTQELCRPQDQRESAEQGERQSEQLRGGSGAHLKVGGLCQRPRSLDYEPKRDQADSGPHPREERPLVREVLPDLGRALLRRVALLVLRLHDI